MSSIRDTIERSLNNVKTIAPLTTILLVYAVLPVVLTIIYNSCFGSLIIRLFGLFIVVFLLTVFLFTRTLEETNEYINLNEPEKSKNDIFSIRGYYIDIVRYSVLPTIAYTIGYLVFFLLSGLIPIDLAKSLVAGGFASGIYLLVFLFSLNSITNYIYESGSFKPFLLV